MKTSIAILSMLLCVGCATKPAPVVISDTNIGGPNNVSPATGKPIAKVKQRVEIPQEALEPCGRLEDMTIDNPTGNDVLKQKARDNLVLTSCSRKNAILVKIIKEAFNIK